MENYESLGMIGEGTYGVVMKACHKETGQIVAIKKFKESDEDEQVRKTSLREVRVLKQLRHDNVITLLEVFRRKGRLHLVFEYVEKTILEVLETRPNGLTETEVRKYMYQLLRGVEYCHTHNIIHRDVKPENILISKNGALKLCDFGFARTMSIGGKYTDYVATRWYRSPELLVGDVEYGKGVDVWAIGCIFAEISNGQPLFPGESDIDQLAHIMRCFGRLTNRQVQIFRRNPLYVGVELPSPNITEPLESRFPHAPTAWLGFLKACLRNDPEQREPCSSLMSLPYFTDRNFRNEYEQELRVLFEKEARQSGVKRPPSDQGGSAGPQSAPVGGSDAGGGGLGGILPQTRLAGVSSNTATPVGGGGSGGISSLPPTTTATQSQQLQQPLHQQSSNTGGLGTVWSQYLASAATELPELHHQHHQQPQPTTSTPGYAYGGIGSGGPSGTGVGGTSTSKYVPLGVIGGGSSLYPKVSGQKNTTIGALHGTAPHAGGGGSSVSSGAGGIGSTVPGGHHAYSSTVAPHDQFMITGGGAKVSTLPAKKPLGGGTVNSSSMANNTGGSGSGSSHLFPTLSGAGYAPQQTSTSPLPQSSGLVHGGGGSGSGATSGGLSAQLNYKKKPQKRNVLSTLSLSAFGGTQQSGATGVNPYGGGGGFEVTGSGTTQGPMHGSQDSGLSRRSSKPWAGS